jgi:hypothetical protein
MQGAFPELGKMGNPMAPVTGRNRRRRTSRIAGRAGIGTAGGMADTARRAG